MYSLIIQFIYTLNIPFKYFYTHCHVITCVYFSKVGYTTLITIIVMTSLPFSVEENGGGIKRKEPSLL